MNPALAATGAGGLAAAVVVVLNGIVNHFFGIAPDATFVAAEVTIATSAAGVGAHFLTRVAPPAAAAKPEAPAAPAQ